jgi:hypothetical protein
MQERAERKEMMEITTIKDKVELFLFFEWKFF